MGSQQFRQWIQQNLAQRDHDGLLRRRRVVEPIDAVHVRIDSRPCINFASNNYLGLTHHPRVCQAAAAAITGGGLGSGAAGLISGYTDVHAAAERELARWKGAAAAVILPSGYQANHAAVQALAAVGKSVPGGYRFLLDKLVHASLVDAVLASDSPFRVFPHNDLEKLRRRLVQADEAGGGGMQIVVTESIFSMDGDAADLRGLAQLKTEHPFVLVLDEAHASGVYGPGGSGWAAECGLQSAVDVSLVTLSKAMGGAGGAVCGSEEFCQAVVNYGRAYIYSTSVPAALAAAAGEAIAVMRQEPQRQQRVRRLAARVRGELAAGGLRIPPGDSPIVPIVLGEESAAMAAAEALLERGMLVAPVRPPTVPRGTSRLRVTLSCEHSDPEIDRLIDALRELKFG